MHAGRGEEMLHGFRAEFAAHLRRAGAGPLRMRLGHEIATVIRHPSMLNLLCPLVLYWITRVWFLARRLERISQLGERKGSELDRFPPGDRRPIAAVIYRCDGPHR